MFSLPHRSPRDLPFVTDHTALLLVDMQRAWLEPQFDPHLEGPDAAYFLNRTRSQVVPNQVRLLNAFRVEMQLRRVNVRTQSRRHQFWLSHAIPAFMIDRNLHRALRCQLETDRSSRGRTCWMNSRFPHTRSVKAARTI